MHLHIQTQLACFTNFETPGPPSLRLGALALDASALGLALGDFSGSLTNKRRSMEIQITEQSPTVSKVAHNVKHLIMVKWLNIRLTTKMFKGTL